MTNDRNYLRMMHDCELIRLAVDSYNETSIVLAERLSALLDIEEQLEAAQNEIRELAASRDHWQAEANMLQASLDRIDAE
jgi:hypothetical protein